MRALEDDVEGALAGGLGRFQDGALDGELLALGRVLLECLPGLLQPQQDQPSATCPRARMSGLILHTACA